MKEIYELMIKIRLPSTKMPLFKTPLTCLALTAWAAFLSLILPKDSLAF